MIIDGRTIAEEIKEELKEIIEKSEKKLSFVVFVMKEDLATKKFIELKTKFGEDIGVRVDKKNVSGIITDEFVAKIKDSVRNYNGIIVQFPLEDGIDADLVRNVIPKTHDIDVVSDEALLQLKEESLVLPPVVGAIAEIMKRNNISAKDRKVVVVGDGRLVGRPSAIWFKKNGAEVKIVTDESSDILEDLKEADIIVLGAGSPGLLKKEMIKDGVIIFDAGTSEEGGKLAGDADPECAEKALIFTPVPGGIGPITVAMIFRNLLALRGIVK